MSNDRGGGGPVLEGPMGPVLVVLLDEGVDQRLEIVDGGRLLGLSVQPLLHRLLKPLDLPAGGGMPGGGVLLDDAQSAELGLAGVQTGGGQLLAQLEDQVDDLDGCGPRDGLRAP